MANGVLDRFYLDRRTKGIAKQLVHAQNKVVYADLERQFSDISHYLDARDKAQGDQNVIIPSTEETPISAFPGASPITDRNPIGTMFDAFITDTTLGLMYSRYQLARVIIDKPVEEALYQGFAIYPTVGDEETKKEWTKKAIKFYLDHKSSLLRFFKLVSLYGYSINIAGFTDRPKNEWLLKPKPGSPIKYFQPVPKPDVSELKQTDGVPVEVLWARVAIETDNFEVSKSRFMHSYNPSLVAENKEGESRLSNVYDLLQVQIHADWAIGQSLWRGASGLLGLEAPKKVLSANEQLTALGSLSNVNARTVVYIPNGWRVRQILSKGGNIAIARTYRVILEQIAAGTGIPVSILLGAQRGAMAPPDGDRETYFRTVGTMQENTMTPALRRFFRLGQISGQVDPGEFVIEWNNLEAKSPVQRKREILELKAIERLTEALDDDDWIKAFDPKELIDLLKGKRGK